MRVKDEQCLEDYEYFCFFEDKLINGHSEVAQGVLIEGSEIEFMLPDSARDREYLVSLVAERKTFQRELLGQSMINIKARPSIVWST